MIIAHLCHGFHPGNGFETFIANLCNNDSDNKNIIILPKGTNEDIGLNPDIDILEITDFFQVADIVDKIQPDVFLIHWTGAESLNKNECTLIIQGTKYYYQLMPGIKRDINNDPFGFLYVAKIIYSVPIYIVAHSEFQIPMHIQTPEITGLIAVSNKAVRVFERNNFKKIVIPNGIDTELYKPEKRDRISKKFTIGWSGRLAKYDIQIYNALKAAPECKDYLFVYFGSGQLETEPPDNHLFLGNVANMHQWLNRLDLFLYPTLIDSFGLSVAEAMACELPIVASQEVGEVVGQAGFIYTTKNNCLSIIKDLKENQYTREVFGRLARKRIIENYSLESMIGAYNNLYRNQLKWITK